MLRNLRPIAVIALLVHASTAPADTQVACPLAWRPDRLPGVGGGQVKAAASWDPDGPGTLTPRLVIGGTFRSAGDVPAGSIAVWDGTTWQPMNAGLTAPVNTLTVFNSDLLVGSNSVLRWNGASWEPFGAGTNSGASSFTVFNGDLIAGGSSTVRRLQGGSWVPFASVNGGLYALTVYNGDLIAAGTFTNIGGVAANRVARWNGTIWQPLGTGINDDVYALAVFNNELIATGIFTTAGGVSVAGIARWNGSIWLPVGTGLGNFPEGRSLLVQNNQLYIGGRFSTPYSGPANFVVRWNGAAYFPVSTGVDGQVFALTTHNGNLVAGGAFGRAGDVIASGVGQWDGAAWSEFGQRSTFGTYGTVNALLTVNTDLIAAGEFTAAGPINADYIARWNGSAWQPMGSGMNGPVRALTLWNGKIIAGGAFGTAGGVSANNVARWTGANWEPIGLGMPAEVNSVCVFRGDLVAGGKASPNGFGYVARWNGNAWESLNLPPFVQTPTIPSMIEFNNELIVGTGGYGGAPYSWNGSTWHEVNYPGLNAWVNAMIIDQGNLVAAGANMPNSGGGETYYRVRRLTGSSWVDILPSDIFPPFNSQSWSLGKFNDALILGTGVQNGGGNNIRSLIQLSGATQYQLGTFNSANFIGPAINAIAIYNGDLVVGGAFSANGINVLPNLARFGPTTELPAIAQQPTPKKINVDGSASFHVATFGGQPQTYQWRKNGANLADDAHITGALTDTLNISPVGLADNGLYDCVVNNACGTATSNQARLTVIGHVPVLGPTQPIGPGNPG